VGDSNGSSDDNSSDNSLASETNDEGDQRWRPRYRRRRVAREEGWEGLFSRQETSGIYMEASRGWEFGRQVSGGDRETQGSRPIEPHP